MYRCRCSAHVVHMYRCKCSAHVVHMYRCRCSAYVLHMYRCRCSAHVVHMYSCRCSAHVVHMYRCRCSAHVVHMYRCRCSAHYTVSIIMRQGIRGSGSGVKPFLTFFMSSFTREKGSSLTVPLFYNWSLCSSCSYNPPAARTGSNINSLSKVSCTDCGSVCCYW